MIDTEFKAYLAQLYAEDDCLRAERRAAERERAGEREPVGGSPVQKNDEPLGLVYREHENALVSDASADASPSDGDEPFDEAQTEVLGGVVSRLRGERDEALAPLERELSRMHALERELQFLKGELEAALTLLGQKEFKAGAVIDLPDFRKRRDVA